ncbi:MerR family transcriptional regulator [Plantactinospora mayteni]|uniref:MerR family transcriptional regulator n=1 Tax=Plantactinospora mayteni TaxID=566021 RepID=A0ABQ4EXS9_9ACTN|nr:MerR family transcriptional regulator [Plantactinospora mayteni]GIG99417.1 MerR family transcriptional regulator [Plantactinospora mayteni]
MRIGALADAAGTTTRTLRFYEQEGLLDSTRTPNGYRDYADGALLRVRNIRELLTIGFTINDVRAFLRFLDRDLPPTFGDSGGCATAMRVADERLTLLRERLHTLTRLHDSLAARLDRPAFGSPGACPPAPQQTLPLSEGGA